MTVPPTASTEQSISYCETYRALPSYSTLASVTPENAGTNISVLALITDVGRPTPMSLGHMQRLRLRGASTTREITVRLFHDREDGLFPYSYVGMIVVLYGMVIVQELGETTLVSARPWEYTYIPASHAFKFDCSPEWHTTTYDYESHPEISYGMKQTASTLFSWWENPERNDWDRWWREVCRIRMGYRWDPERGEGEVVEF